MDYIFEKGTKGEGEVMKMLERAAKEPGVYEAMGLVPNGFSFQPKQRLVQFQAADMLAYESYRHMKIVKETGDKVPRRGYFKFLLSTGRVECGFHNDESLPTVIDKIRAEDIARAAKLA